jgi:hypothetical protein
MKTAEEILEAHNCIYTGCVEESVVNVVAAMEEYKNQFIPKGDAGLLFTQFPGKEGSNVHDKSEEDELNDLEQELSGNKPIPDIDLWAEVAKEFHFTKPFHETVIKSITQRLIDKGFSIHKSTTPPQGDRAFSMEDMEKAVEFGYRQNVLNGCINFKEQSDFISSLNKQ